MSKFSFYQSGRSMLELLAVLAIITLLTTGGIVLYQKTMSSQEGESIYQDILTTAASVRTRGTTRKGSEKGIADTQLAYDETRLGKKIQTATDCPEGAFTIKIKNVNKALCESLMDKEYPPQFQPIAFFRSDDFDAICSGKTLGSGTTMTSKADCSGIESASAFAVVFESARR